MLADRLHDRKFCTQAFAVDRLDGGYRGRIRPADWDRFFARYTQLLVHHAQLARAAGGVELFVVGTELDSAASGPAGRGELWTSLVRAKIK